MSRKFQHLRRTVSPYIGQIIILSFVTFFILFISFKMHEYKLLLITPVIWILFIPLIYFGLKYQIFWNDEELFQRVSGQSDVYIKYTEISKVASETSKPNELITAGRPFRRIVIYAGNAQVGSRFIDVSLKHFVMNDVRSLMRVIHEHRPDLVLPKH
jgi:hypothetical protein